MRRRVVPGGPHPCAGRPDVFLTPGAERDETRLAREAEAKAICAGCDARPECLEVALTNRIEHGGRVDVDIWAGMTATERVELLRHLPVSAS